MDTDSEITKPETPPAIIGTPRSRAILTASTSADWGTPEIVRRFAAAVLRPAARGSTAIDLDASSSAYWQEQWVPSDRPAGFFDGSKGRDAMVREDYDAVLRAAAVGTLFDNPPGNPSGETIQRIYRIIDALHREEKIDSAFWVGFSLEQLRSLIPKEGNEAMRDPLHPDHATVFPFRRISYMVHPVAMLKILAQRIASMEKHLKAYPDDAKKTADLKTLNDRRHVLENRSDDSPIKGPSPTHASYLTIMWSHSAKIKRQQIAAARAFLKGQCDVPMSELARSRVVGAW